MSENNSTGDTLLTLILGAAVGVAAGLLLAPQKGKETRRRLRRWLETIEDDLREEGFEDVVERGKDAVREKAQAAKDKVDAVIKDAFKQGREPRDRG